MELRPIDPRLWRSLKYDCFSFRENQVYASGGNRIGNITISEAVISATDQPQSSGCAVGFENGLREKMSRVFNLRQRPSGATKLKPISRSTASANISVIQAQRRDTRHLPLV